MSATATVTGTAGPGIAVTAVVYTGVTNVAFDCEKDILSLTISGRVIDISISAATTITATKSGSTYTFTVS